MILDNKIHIRIDNNGFVWVNLDSKEMPEVAWEDDFAGVDVLEKFKYAAPSSICSELYLILFCYIRQYNMDDYVFDHVWQMDGAYNWKILADNYNECYHCATAHPDISALANLQSYSVDTKLGQIIHDPATTEAQRQAGLTVAATYHFPNVSTNIS